jgi:hypothetical protein
MTAETTTNDTKAKCANCGHAAAAHGKDGFSACNTKTCRGRSEPCMAFLFPADGGEGATPEGTEPDDAGETTTEQTMPDDAAYDPARPFNPSDHMRVLVHKNKRGEVVGESHYLDVKWRIAWLRSASGVIEGHLPAHPTWRIESEALMPITDMVRDGFAVFRARLWGQEGDGGEFDVWTMISEAHGSEDKDDWRDFIEKAETKAIGRCLANAGYGTAAAAEFEEGDRIADSGVARGGTRKRDPLVGEDGTPHPDCQRKNAEGENLGHGAGSIRRMEAKFPDQGGRWQKGEEIYWCAQKVDGKACGWAASVKEWKDYLAKLNADDPGDPNDPAASESKPDPEPDPEPTPGESLTPSSASAEGSSGETGSPEPSSDGTPPAASSRSQRPTTPSPSNAGTQQAAFNVPAFQAALGEASITVADIKRVFDLETPTAVAFAALMAEHGWTEAELVQATVDAGEATP